MVHARTRRSYRLNGIAVTACRPYTRGDIASFSSEWSTSACDSRMRLDWFQTLVPFRDHLGNDATRVLALICSDNERRALEEIASKCNWRLCLASTPLEAGKQLQEQTIGVILCDRDLPGNDWRNHIAYLLRSAPNSCVILVSGVNDEYLWEEVIRNGGYDVLTKPFQASQVVPAVTLAWSYWKQYALKR